MSAISRDCFCKDLDAKQIAGANRNSLFVLGRNVLQAAHGSANAAKDWIVRFCEHTEGLKAPARKAIIDGILFEIFFDSDGELRKHPKNHRRLSNKGTFGIAVGTPAEEAEIHAGLIAGLENGTVRPVVGKELPLAEAARAHKEVLEPGAGGKVVLVC
jgi:NADPH:quinone reductase-like Zn-dependent oxidoreductase